MEYGNQFSNVKTFYEWCVENNRMDLNDRFDEDLYYLMKYFDQVAAEALKDYPLYEKLVELYNQRDDLYNKYCDYKIDGNQSICKIINTIVRRRNK